MVPNNFAKFIDELLYQAKINIIPLSRINDAVLRILRVKFIMGLFENPLADLCLANQLGSKVHFVHNVIFIYGGYSIHLFQNEKSLFLNELLCAKQEHRDLVREAVRKSLVSLKNGKPAEKPLLPLPKKAGKILVTGSHADNLGYQCGGWTITWQGLSGNNLIVVVYNENPDANFVKSHNFSSAIVVVGEHSYAETYSDSSNLTISDPGPSTLTNVYGFIKRVVVLVTGRPVVIQPYLPRIDALVSAWLPPTEGRGVADLLFGDYGFTGKLERTWFKTVDQLPMNVGDRHYESTVM